MMFDPAIDSLEDVLAIRAQAMTMLKQGAQVMEWQNESQSARLGFNVPLETIMVETKAYMDAYARGAVITRTNASYFTNF